MFQINVQVCLFISEILGQNCSGEPNRKFSCRTEPNRTRCSRIFGSAEPNRTELLDFEFGRTELFGRKLAELFGRTEPNFLFCFDYEFFDEQTLIALIILVSAALALFSKNKSGAPFLP